MLGLGVGCPSRRAAGAADGRRRTGVSGRASAVPGLGAGRAQSAIHFTRSTTRVGAVRSTETVTEPSRGQHQGGGVDCVELVLLGRVGLGGGEGGGGVGGDRASASTASRAAPCAVSCSEILALPIEIASNSTTPATASPRVTRISQLPMMSPRSSVRARRRTGFSTGRSSASGPATLSPQGDLSSPSGGVSVQSAHGDGAGLLDRLLARGLSGSARSARRTTGPPARATPTPTVTAAAPNQKAACTPTSSASRSATNGPIAPPVNRTKEYAAEATGRSTGAEPITASVTRVLTTPRNAPATTMPPATTASCAEKAAIAARSRANRARTAVIVGTVPNRCCSRGATTTEVIAEQQAPAEEGPADVHDVEAVQREGPGGHEREEAQVVEDRDHREQQQRRVAQSAERVGQGRPASLRRRGRAGRNAVATSATVISTETPKNGAAPGHAGRAARPAAGRTRCRARAPPRTG